MRNRLQWWESGSFAFVRVPKAILMQPYYSGLSANAVLLYGILLDRVSLSFKNKNKFTDRNGDVFIYFTLKEICETLSCGHDKATKLLRELEMYELITRVQQGKGRPARIYVLEFLNL